MDSEIPSPTEVISDVSEAASETVENAENKFVSALEDLRNDVRLGRVEHTDALGRIESSVRELANAVTDALTRTAVAATEAVTTPIEVAADVPGAAAEKVDTVVENVEEEPIKFKKGRIVRRR